MEPEHLLRGVRVLRLGPCIVEFDTHYWSCSICACTNVEVVVLAADEYENCNMFCTLVTRLPVLVMPSLAVAAVSRPVVPLLTPLWLACATVAPLNVTKNV